MTDTGSKRRGLMYTCAAFVGLSMLGGVIGNRTDAAAVVAYNRFGGPTYQEIGEHLAPVGEMVGYLVPEARLLSEVQADTRQIDANPQILFPSDVGVIAKPAVRFDIPRLTGPKPVLLLPSPSHTHQGGEHFGWASNLALAILTWLGMSPDSAKAQVNRARAAVQAFLSKAEKAAKSFFRKITGLFVRRKNEA